MKGSQKRDLPDVIASLNEYVLEWIRRFNATKRRTADHRAFEPAGASQSGCKYGHNWKSNVLLTSQFTWTDIFYSHAPLVTRARKALM